MEEEPSKLLGDVVIDEVSIVLVVGPLSVEEFELEVRDALSLEVLPPDVVKEAIPDAVGSWEI